MRGLTRLAIPVAFASMLLVPSTVVDADVFVCIDGISGSYQVSGFGDCIQILEFHHLVTGAAATNHEPVVFVKERNDASTVGLLQNLDSPSQFVEARFYFRTTQPPQEIYQEIRLADVWVSAIEPWSRVDSSALGEFDRVRVAYRSMEVLTTAQVPPVPGGPFPKVVHVTGDTVGPINGSHSGPPAPGSIDVAEFHHLIHRSMAVPPDHEEVIFTKQVDVASSGLWSAYSADESLTVSFEYWRQYPTDPPVWLVTQQVDLTGSTIVAIERYWNGNDPPGERIRLRYSQMTLTNTVRDPLNGNALDSQSYTINGNFQN